VFSSTSVRLLLSARRTGQMEPGSGSVTCVFLADQRMVDFSRESSNANRVVAKTPFVTAMSVSGMLQCLVHAA